MSHPCEHEGCTHEGVDCYLPDDEEPSYRFCSEHAHVEGFCYGCGGFFAGIETFDFSQSGLCENCEGDEDEDRDDDEDEPDYLSDMIPW